MVRVLPRQFGGLVLGLVLLSGCSDDAPTAGATATANGPAVTPATEATEGDVPTPAATTPSKPQSAAPIDTQAPSVAITTAPAVTVGTTTKLSNGVKVLVSKVVAVKVEASGPGDIAGDGVAIHLTVKNTSAKSFDLNGLAVTASYGTAQPASPGGAGTGDPLSGNLKAGKEAKGVYVFTVPKSKASSVEVQVSSDASPIIVVYKR